jgi:hypothetical protein
MSHMWSQPVLPYKILSKLAQMSKGTLLILSLGLELQLHNGKKYKVERKML